MLRRTETWMHQLVHASNHGTSTDTLKYVPRLKQEVDV